MASAEAATGDNDSKKGFVQRIKAIIPTKTERKKLIPLAVMFFCILFNYTILRDTKDVLMVTAPKSGAEVIPYIKTWLNLPIAILFTGVYAKMTDSMDQKTVFYSLVVSFLAFFATFALVIYPQRAVLHPHVLIDRLAALLPMNFAAPLAIIRNWSFAVFYVMAEMWGSVVASLLFWGLANEVTTVEEAKKYCTFADAAGLTFFRSDLFHFFTAQIHCLVWARMLRLSSRGSTCVMSPCCVPPWRLVSMRGPFR